MSDAAHLGSDGGVTSRRVAESCDPVVEALKYEPLIDQRAHVVLSWNRMSERAASLRIPVRVVSIEDGAIGVRMLQAALRNQYISVWLHSGHIRAAPEGVFLLDPCSATIVAWPEEDEAAAADAREDDEGWLDDNDDLEDDAPEHNRVLGPNPAWPVNVGNPDDLGQ
jgi:hypothetical protein